MRYTNIMVLPIVHLNITNNKFILFEQTIIAILIIGWLSIPLFFKNDISLTKAALYINDLLFDFLELKLNYCVSLSFSNIRGVEKKKLKHLPTLKESIDITYFY